MMPLGSKQMSFEDAARLVPDGAVVSVSSASALGVPLTDFAFGCAANADAILPSPQQFTCFQGGGVDCAMLSFMEVDRV